MSRLDQARVVIARGARGIGAATAKRVAAEEAHVMVGDLRGETAPDRRGREGIGCNAIDPGAITTENQMEMVTDEERAIVQQMTPPPRLGAAAVVAFLLPSDGAWVNGQIWAAQSSPGAQ